MLDIFIILTVVTVSHVYTCQNLSKLYNLHMCSLLYVSYTNKTVKNWWKLM